MTQDYTDRGKRASFDRKTGEVSGSGAGAGNGGSETEDYDSDTKVKMPAEKSDVAKQDVAPGGGN